MNSRQFVVILLLLMIAAGWWLYPARQQPGSIDVRDERREAFAEAIHLQVMDEQGKPVWHLRATGLDYYPDDDRVILDQPRVSLLHADGSHWELQADHGRTDPDGYLVTLTGNVSLRRLADATHKPVAVTTSDMRIWPGSGQAVTSTAARISGAGYRIDSVGLRADTKQHRLELNSQVRGNYDAAG